MSLNTHTQLLKLYIIMELSKGWQLLFLNSVFELYPCFDILRNPHVSVTKIFSTVLFTSLLFTVVRAQDNADNFFQATAVGRKFINEVQGFYQGR